MERYPGRPRGRAVFDTGKQQGTTAAMPGVAGIFGAMRNKPGVKPGRPIPFGERPVNRPMAAELGSSKDFSDTTCHNSPGKSTEPRAKQSARERINMPLFSWERPSSA